MKLHIHRFNIEVKRRGRRNHGSASIYDVITYACRCGKTKDKVK